MKNEIAVQENNERISIVISKREFKKIAESTKNLKKCKLSEAYATVVNVLGGGTQSEKVHNVTVAYLAIRYPKFLKERLDALSKATGMQFTHLCSILNLRKYSYFEKLM